MVLVSLVLGIGQSHATEILFGVDTGSKAFFRVDVSDASVSEIARLTSTFVFPAALAQSKVNKALYLRDALSLYSVDPANGDLALIGGGAGLAWGLTFDGASAFLYSKNRWDSGGSQQLLRIDPLTGNIVDILDTGIDTGNVIEDLSVNSHGEVYAGTGSGSIIKIDPVTGRGEVVYVDATGGLGLGAIAFDSSDNLYGVTLNSDLLIRIDLSTGTYTTMGSLPYGDVRGLAFATEPFTFPAPTGTNGSSGVPDGGATLALLGSAFMLLSATNLRRLA